MRIITNSLHIALLEFSGNSFNHFARFYSLSQPIIAGHSRSLWIWLAWNNCCCKFDDCSLHCHSDFDRKATHNTKIWSNSFLVDEQCNSAVSFSILFLCCFFCCCACFFVFWLQLWIIFQPSRPNRTDSEAKELKKVSQKVFFRLLNE